jgi:hypothetical protein
MQISSSVGSNFGANQHPDHQLLFLGDHLPQFGDYLVITNRHGFLVLPLDDQLAEVGGVFLRGFVLGGGYVFADFYAFLIILVIPINTSRLKPCLQSITPISFSMQANRSP